MKTANKNKVAKLFSFLFTKKKYSAIKFSDFFDFVSLMKIVGKADFISFAVKALKKLSSDSPA